MKKITILTLSLLLVMTMGILFLTGCPGEDPPPEGSIKIIADADIDNMPDIEACVADTADMTEFIFTTGVIEGIPEEIPDGDMSWLCDVTVGGVKITDVVNSCYLDAFLEAAISYAVYGGSTDAIGDALNDLLGIILTDSNIEVVKDVLWDVIQAMDASAIACIGDVAHYGISAIYNDLEDGGTWISGILEDALYGDGKTAADLEAELQDGDLATVLNMLGLGEDGAIVALLGQLDAAVVQLVQDLIDGLVDSNENITFLLVAYAVNAEEEAITEAMVGESVDELAVLIEDVISPAIGNFLGTVLGALPDAAKSTLSSLTVDSLRGVASGMANGGIGCTLIESSCSN